MILKLIFLEIIGIILEMGVFICSKLPSIIKVISDSSRHFRKFHGARKQFFSRYWRRSFLFSIIEYHRLGNLIVRSFPCFKFPLLIFCYKHFLRRFMPNIEMIRMNVRWLIKIRHLSFWSFVVDKSLIGRLIIR